MTESRCGLLCSECAYREQMNCKGCVYIQKPFWGESCPVKSCSEAKGHEHCGHCKEFPCELLKGFAFDKEQGDDGGQNNAGVGAKDAKFLLGEVINLQPAYE